MPGSHSREDNLNIDLSGRTALVTGAGQGVGAAIAREFAASGARVVVNDYVGERAEEVAGRINADHPGVALPVQADVTSWEGVQAMALAAGTVDILVNNAGNAGADPSAAGGGKTFDQTTPDEWDPWIRVNLYGPMHCARAVVPGMIDRAWGRIVTIISDAGRVGEPRLAVYSAAKAGAAGFSRALAKEVGRYMGITVNTVALGGVKTPTTARAYENPEAVARAFSRYSIRRPGEPEDVANLVCFLASDRASWITGQTYPVNGGYSSAV